MNKPKYKQFNLSEAAKFPGRVRFRYGEVPYMVIQLPGAENSYPIMALTRTGERSTHTETGAILSSLSEHPRDLVLLNKKP
jgi:hypothetical protein